LSLFAEQFKTAHQCL